MPRVAALEGVLYVCTCQKNLDSPEFCICDRGATSCLRQVDKHFKMKLNSTGDPDFCLGAKLRQAQPAEPGPRARRRASEARPGAARAPGPLPRGAPGRRRRCRACSPPARGARAPRPAKRAPPAGGEAGSRPLASSRRRAGGEPAQRPRAGYLALSSAPPAARLGRGRPAAEAAELAPARPARQAAGAGAPRAGLEEEAWLARLLAAAPRASPRRRESPLPARRAPAQSSLLAERGASGRLAGLASRRFAGRP